MTASEITAIRYHARLSQAELAALVNVCLRTVQFWEQGRRHPGGPAVQILREIESQTEVEI